MGWSWALPAFMSSTSYITGSSLHKFSVKNSQAGSNLTKRRVFFSLGVSGNGWRGWCSCWGRTFSWLLPRVLHHLNQLRVLHNTFSVRLMMVMLRDDNADSEEERASNWPLPGVLHRPSHQLYIISTWLILSPHSRNNFNQMRTNVTNQLSPFWPRHSGNRLRASI